MGTTTFDERIPIPPKRTGETGRVRLAFLNCLRTNSYGISVAVHRISLPDASDNTLFDQIDAVAAFEVIGDPNRTVHYKFHNPIETLLVE
jgi:hypothetical protein